MNGWGGVGFDQFLVYKCFCDLATLKLLDRSCTFEGQKQLSQPFNKHLLRFLDLWHPEMSENRELSHHGHEENGKGILIVGLYLLT